MIENFVGVCGMPLGLCLNMVVNGNEYVVPMVVEEPSVVAAVSGVGKLVAKHGGFKAVGPSSNMVIAQIQLLDIKDGDIDSIVGKINDKQDEILRVGNSSIPSMVARGGGVSSISVNKIPKSKPRLLDSNYWLVLHLHINVCEAMGANCASTVAESVSLYLQSIIECRIGIRIVSNLIPSRKTSSEFKISVEALDYKGFSGMDVAERICEANDWARDDLFRSVTHNKGIMNGIDSVCIATGQDWRAVESASHAYPIYNNTQYGPFTDYKIVKEGGECFLVGQLSLPLQVGVKGGALNTNPLYKYTLGLLNNPSSKDLAMVNLDSYLDYV